MLWAEIAFLCKFLPLPLSEMVCEAWSTKVRNAQAVQSLSLGELALGWPGQYGCVQGPQDW